MSTVNVHDVLLFHRLDRKYFDKILDSGRNPATARNIIALWMWLEMISIDVFTHLKNSAADESKIFRFIAEAETILSFLRPNASLPPPPNSGIPLTASLISEQLDLRFFYFHSETVVRGMTRILDGVGRLIFDDGLKSLMDSYEFSVRDVADIGRRLRVSYPVPAMPSQLARAYVSGPTAAPEDFRALFVTFSKGHPLNREDIIQYFTEKWGECIERVMLELSNNHTTPMYGRIIFKSDSFIGLVLNGQHLVKFMIKGRQMWARQYVPWRTSM